MYTVVEYIFAEIFTIVNRMPFEHVLNPRCISFLGNTLIDVIEVVVVVGEPKRQTLDYPRLQLCTRFPPLLFSVVLNQLFIHGSSNKGDCLFFKVPWRFKRVFLLVLLDFVLNNTFYDARRHHLHTKILFKQSNKCVHVEREIIGLRFLTSLIVIHGNRTVHKVVERSELVRKLPYIRVRSMEDMCAILVNSDAIHLFSIAVATEVLTLLDDSDVKWINIELVNQTLIDYSVVETSTN